MTTETVLTVIGVGFAVFAFAAGIAIYMYFFRLWVKTLMSGTPIPVFALLRMPFKKIHPVRMVDYYIDAAKAELNISLAELESLYVMGGNVERTLQTLIEAKEAGQALSLAEASEKHTRDEKSTERMQSNSQSFAARQQSDAQRRLGN